MQHGKLRSGLLDGTVFSRSQCISEASGLMQVGRNDSKKVARVSDISTAVLRLPFDLYWNQVNALCVRISCGVNCVEMAAIQAVMRHKTNGLSIVGMCVCVLVCLML